MRRGDRLRETCEILDFWAHYTLDKIFDNALGWETQNELTVARLVAACALERTESIGVHHRGDSASDTSKPPYHLTISRNQDGTMPTRAHMQEPAVNDK